MTIRILGAVTVLLALLVGTLRLNTPSPVTAEAPAIHYDVDAGGSGPTAHTGSWNLVVQPTATATSTPTATATPAPTRPRYIVVMVLDGARPDYFNVPGIPHVRALMQRGTVYNNAFAGLLESETPAGHATIGTGMSPNANGILGFGWQDETDNWVSIFSPALIQSHVMENLMSHSPSLAGRLHQRDSSIKVAAVGSYKYYANDALGGPDADYTLFYAPTADGKFAPIAVPGHVPPARLLQRPDVIAPTYKNLPLGESDSLAMRLAGATLTETGAQVIMLNIPQFDQPLGHVYGANRDQKDVRTLMQGFDRDLATLEATYQKAGVLDQTMFVITADHGFQAFDHIIPPEQIIGAVTRAGLTVTHGTYDSADYLWVNHHARADEAAASIARMMNPHIQSVYFKETATTGVRYVRASGSDLFRTPHMEEANQLLLQSFAGPSSPDVVVFFRQGTDGVRSDAGWKGDHGGADWESQHIPLIMAGPGIRQNYVSSYPARLMDVTPTIISLFGANYGGMDGTPLADALTQPPSDAASRQASQRASLTQAVSAMTAESVIERAQDQ